MTSSRSSINRWLIAVALVLWATAAQAGGRKRVVVLDFEGPKAEKFHDDLVRIIKKTHTVVATDKWNGAAEEADAAKITEKNVKKVAKKLKIDGIVTGKVEKRRDEYILRLRLRAGTSGEIVGNSIETKAEGPRIDGKAQRDIKDELIGAIDELEANHGGGGGDDDEDKPAKKKRADDAADDADDKPVKKKRSDADDDDKPAKHGGFAKHDDDTRGSDKIGDKKKKAKPDDDADDDDKPAKKTAKKDDDKKKKAKSDDDDRPAKKTAKSDDDDKPVKKTAKKDDDDTAAALSTKHDDDDESPLPKSKKRATDDQADDDAPKKKHKRVAKGDDDDGGSAEAEADDAGGSGMDSAEALSPSQRAVDAVVGLSFIARHLAFSYAGSLAGNQIPPGYKQSVPVAGAMFDVTIFPFAIGHKNKGPLAGLGLTVLYDRVLKINSQKTYIDQTTNMSKVADLQTVEDRYAIGAVYRYPLGKGASATVVGGKLVYEHHQFGIQQALPDGSATDVPNVAYSMIEPGAFLRYPATPKIVLNLDVGYLLVTGNGDIGTAAQYGKGSTSGVEAAVGGDYMLTKNLFVRALGRIERIGLSFSGEQGSKATSRGSDPTMQTVFGATDLYFGGEVTVGYLY